MGFTYKGKQDIKSFFHSIAHTKRTYQSLIFLFILGLKDRVQCVYCGVCLEDWDTKDDIFEEHHKNAPECSLMLRFLQHQSSFTDNSVL